MSIPVDSVENIIKDLWELVDKQEKMADRNAVFMPEEAIANRARAGAFTTAAEMLEIRLRPWLSKNGATDGSAR